VKNLLLVDDENLALSSLSEALKLFDADFNIFTAGNGDEALRILESTHIDLLITDLNMPVKSGFELLSHLSKKQYNTPVIVMTAEDVETCRKLPFSNVKHFLIKPFEFETLVQVIYEYLDYNPNH
jgi:two-component system response regulator YesN